MEHKPPVVTSFQSHDVDSARLYAVCCPQAPRRWWQRLEKHKYIIFHVIDIVKLNAHVYSQRIPTSL